MFGESRRSNRLVIGAALIALGILVALVVIVATTARSRTTQTKHVSDSFDGVTSVVVVMDTGDVRIGTAAGDHATAEADMRWNTRHEPRYTTRLDAGVLTVRASGCDTLFLGISCRIDLTMTVPAQVPLNVSADSGSITASGMRGPVKVSVDSGDADLTDVTGSLTAKIDSGDLTGTGLSSATVEVSVDSGDVHLEFANAPTDVRARVDSADVVILVPAGSGPYTVQTSVDSGKTTVGVPTAPAGSHRISATVDSGNVTIGYRS